MRPKLEIEIRQPDVRVSSEPMVKELVFRRVFDEHHSTANVERMTVEELMQLASELHKFFGFTIE